MITFAAIWNVVFPFIKMALILLIGHLIIGYVVKLLDKAISKSKLDASLIKYILKATNIVLHVFIILSALNSIGISTTGLLAALSAAAVGIALALKDSLGNVAGGILLLISPRFSTGDYVSAGGSEGTVTAVDLLHTTVLTVDSRQVSIPNGVLINSHIINYSCENKRRVDIAFSVDYGTDIEKAKKVIFDTISAHPLVVKEPSAPFVRVSGYEDSAITIATRSWCATADYWNVYFDLLEQVKTALDANGINIPYNQLDIHIKKED